MGFIIFVIVTSPARRFALIRPVRACGKEQSERAEGEIRDGSVAGREALRRPVMEIATHEAI
jgi:hypothetical protein